MASWYGIVLGLSLVAIRAEAQNDSLLLRLRFTAKGYPYNFTTTVTDRHGDTLQGTEYSGAVFLHLDTTLIVPIRDSVNIITGPSSPPENPYGPSSVSFRIDSLGKFLRSVTFQQDGTVGGSTGYGGQPGFGFWQYKVVFDSIDYQSNGRAVSISTLDSGNYSWMASWGSESNFFYTEIGGQNGSGIEEDSLSIELSPYQASVTPSIREVCLFSVIANNGSLTASFAASDLNKKLEIEDLLGRVITSFNLLARQTQFRSTVFLPPGLYFARLGDQMAKFVVPPR